GVSLAAAMAEAGLDPARIPALARRREDLLGYLEVHIEQGPVLLEAGLPVGIVSAIAGSVRSMITITGTAGHAGTLPSARGHGRGRAGAVCRKALRSGAHARGHGGATRRPRRRDQHHSRALRAFPRCARRRRRHPRCRGVRHQCGNGTHCGKTWRQDRERRGTANGDRALLAAPANTVVRCCDARRPKPARASERGRPRCHDVRFAHRHCHVVRALRKWRRQPFAAGNHHGRGCRYRRACHARCRAAACRDVMTLPEVVAAFVDREFPRQTQFLAELVKVPSDNPPGDCAAHAKRARHLLEQLALAVEGHDVPHALVGAPRLQSASNLVIRRRFGDGPIIALNAHGDVVPPGLGWRRDPYGATIEEGPHGGVMYGRGVAVSKSDFATYTWALLALKAAVAQDAKLG